MTIKVLLDNLNKTHSFTGNESCKWYSLSKMQNVDARLFVQYINRKDEQVLTETKILNHSIIFLCVLTQHLSTTKSNHTLSESCNNSLVNKFSYASFIRQVKHTWETMFLSFFFSPLKKVPPRKIPNKKKSPKKSPSKDRVIV